MHATRSKIVLLALCSLLLIPCSLLAQRIPEMIEYTEIYDFLEELTTDGVIQTNAAIKPYTRDYIAARLMEDVEHFAVSVAVDGEGVAALGRPAFLRGR